MYLEPTTCFFYAELTRFYLPAVKRIPNSQSVAISSLHNSSSIRGISILAIITENDNASQIFTLLKKIFNIHYTLGTSSNKE